MSAREEDDPGARLAALSGRVRLLVLHLAGRAVLARVEPEDLVQEVFLRALSSGLPAPSPDDPDDARLFAFLAAIARHAVVDAARAIRAARRDGRERPLARSDWSRVPESERASAVASASPGPRTRAGETESFEHLARAYLELAPDHRRVIGLRQFEGLGAAEAGRRMGRGEAATHSLYRRALEAWARASGG